MTPEQEIIRGEEADRIINAPVFIEAMEKIKSHIVEQWGAASAKDTQSREWLWHHYQAALRFEEILTSVMNTGKMAALKKTETVRDKAMRIWGR